VVYGNLRAAELAAGKTISEVGDHLDGNLLDADPLGACDPSAKAAAAVSGPMPGMVISRSRAGSKGLHHRLDPPVELGDHRLQVVQVQAAEHGVVVAEPALQRHRQVRDLGPHLALRQVR
jgi:hypothetical protein